MHRIIVAGALVLALLVGSAWADHSWNGYHWKSTNLAPTVVSKTTSALYDVPAGVSEWTTLGTPIQPSFSPGTKGKVVVSEGFSPFWYGQARIFLDSSGHITKGEVKLNTLLLEPLGAAAADHVLCQELGHVLGLDHQRTASDSCMNDIATIGSATRPNAHDAEQLGVIYGHTDSGGGRRSHDSGWRVVDTVMVP